MKYTSACCINQNRNTCLSDDRSKTLFVQSCLNATFAASAQSDSHKCVIHESKELKTLRGEVSQAIEPGKSVCVWKKFLIWIWPPTRRHLLISGTAGSRERRKPRVYTLSWPRHATIKLRRPIHVSLKLSLKFNESSKQSEEWRSFHSYDILTRLTLQLELSQSELWVMRHGVRYITSGMAEFQHRCAYVFPAWYGEAFDTQVREVIYSFDFYINKATCYLCRLLWWPTTNATVALADIHQCALGARRCLWYQGAGLVQ